MDKQPRHSEELAAQPASRPDAASAVPEQAEPTLEYVHPPYITLAHTFNAPAEWKLEPRAFKQYQFQYVVDGAAEYIIEGQRYITRRGDLICHAPNELHSVSTIPGERYVCLSLLFHFGNIDYPLDTFIGSGHLIGNFDGHPVEQKLSQLVANYHQSGLHHRVLCQGLLLQIFYELAKRREELNPQTGIQRKNASNLVLIKNYLLNHYAEPVKHTDLEEVSGMSRNYIITKFKETFGMTPFEYLAWIRVERAKELAVQTNLTVTEIAERVGYADVHTFGRMFKQKTGMSLSQFSASIVT
ncbi:helix-turn-helix transcriptional regulator [Paenibacillus gansuensis]|uniref:AraC family transcriptional regulator n=1 Tax=Paenibacillus gansuensis TaxID=306542 RepID=A0ABW5PE11_9BACL